MIDNFNEEGLHDLNAHITCTQTVVQETKRKILWHIKKAYIHILKYGTNTGYFYTKLTFLKYFQKDCRKSQLKEENAKYYIQIVSPSTNT